MDWSLWDMPTSPLTWNSHKKLMERFDRKDLRDTLQGVGTTQTGWDIGCIHHRISESCHHSDKHI
jgi:hypothetical protein